MLIQGFFDPLADRGWAVLSAARRTLGVWGDALAVGWPLANPLALSAAEIEPNDEPKQAPEMKPITVRTTELIASGPEVCAYRRAFADGILLMA